MWGPSVNTDRGVRNLGGIDRDEGQRHEAAAPRGGGDRRPGAHGDGRGASQCGTGRRRAGRRGEGGSLRPRRRRRRARRAAARRRPPGPVAPVGRRRPAVRERAEGRGAAADRGAGARHRRPDEGDQGRLLQGLGPGGDHQAEAPRRAADQAREVRVRGLERRRQGGERHRLCRRVGARRARRAPTCSPSPPGPTAGSRCRSSAT